jgi:hypothetical protein
MNLRASSQQVSATPCNNNASLTSKILDMDKIGRMFGKGGAQSVSGSSNAHTAVTNKTGATGASAGATTVTSMHSSHQVKSLINNTYGTDYALASREKERMMRLDENLKKRKPIFKNYIESNANIVRGQMTKKNL